MDDRLKNLKRAMDHTTFNKVTFTEKHQLQIQQQLESANLSKIILSMLLQPKSGIELTQLLHIRGIKQINKNEGLVYTILHEAEHNGWLTSSWDQDTKFYKLTKLGKKQILQQDLAEKGSLKEKLFGVKMHVE